MSQPIIMIIMAAVFTAMMAIIQSLYWAWIVKRRSQKQELARRLGTVSESEFSSLFRDQARDAASQALGALGEHLHILIAQADANISVGILLIRMGLATAIGMLFGMALLGSFGLIAGMLFGFIPYLLLKRQANRRARRLLEQLPDALDLLARSLQAGLGLNDGFRTCAEELQLPIAGEFGRVFEEVRFGRDYRDALDNLIKRNPNLFDLRLFVSSVLLQRETGGNLIEILENIANTIRQRFLFHAKVRAMTSEAKFSALILGSLPLFVGAIILFMNPQYLNPLVEDSMGNMFAMYAVGSYAIGIYLMYSLAQVEV